MDLPNDILDLKYQDEISLQVLAQYKLKGLGYHQLLKIQQKIPIVYPWDCGYQTYRNNYNRRFTYFPMSIIRCSCEKDVQRSIKFVKKYGLQFSVRSGGHCYLQYSLNTGIIIDLFEMSKIKVIQTDESCRDETQIRSKKYVEIGPGARLGVVIKELSYYNLSLPVGSCVNTATAGLTLGGGISPSLIRLSGLMMDHLVGADILLASGEILRVNNEKYSDLYFALRGAGNCNFGIVTKLIFNPCKFRGATVFNLQYPWKLFKQVLDMWQKFAPFTDRRLSTEIDVEAPAFLKEGEFPIQFKGQFEGCEQELKELLSDFLELATQGSVYIQKVETFADSGIFWGATRQTYFENLSIFWLNEISDDAMDVFQESLQNAPSAGSSIELNAMMGAVSDIKSDQTAFPYRKALFWNQLRGTTLEPEDLPAQQLWVNNLYQALTPFTKKFEDVVPGYANAPQNNLVADQKYLKSYYADNVQKLLEVKKKYDPQDVFKYPQSIPLED